MYNKIAVITDNQFLAKKFYNILNNNDRIERFQFYTSPFSNLNQFDIEKIKAIDLKKNNDVELLINNYNLIFSIHCKQLFPPKLVNAIKCINIHPGYNPINRGWYPQVFAIINDTDVGATIHEMDEKLDNGSIIDRKKVNKYSYDTSLSLYNRIVNAELELLRNNITDIIENTYTKTEPEDDGYLFLKKDFNNLLRINLNEKGTYADVINRLRALTHGDFKNAYYFDNDGNKIFIKIILEKE